MMLYVDLRHTQLSHTSQRGFHHEKTESTELLDEFRGKRLKLIDMCRLEAIKSRLEAIAIRLEAIAIMVGGHHY